MNFTVEIPHIGLPERREGDNKAVRVVDDVQFVGVLRQK